MAVYEVLDNGQVLIVTEEIKKPAVYDEEGNLVEAEVKFVFKNHYDTEFHTDVTADKSSILADGIEVVVISAVVIDYLGNIQTDYSGPVDFVMNDDQRVTVTAAGGTASTVFASAEVGEFTFRTDIPKFRNGSVKVGVTGA